MPHDSPQAWRVLAVHIVVAHEQAAFDTLVGETLGGRWVLDEVLGEGAMGRVYRAHHNVLQRSVAVKVLRSELANNDDVAARFLREARAASTIDSPYVVEVIDFGRWGKTHFLVMEYLAGRSLEAVVSQGAMPLPMIYDLAIALAEGLGAAHAAGVVHRDVKPDNVVLLPHGDGTFACKIVDFGIAKVRDDVCGARLTTPGSMIGTPYYMSPEHCLGNNVDHRSDIYSLGAMLYELVTGMLPFDGESLAGVLAGHLTMAPTPVRKLVPECPPLLAQVVSRCMEKRPEDRYADMNELRAALELARAQALGDATARSSSIRPVAPIAVVREPSQHFKRAGALGGLAAVAAACLALVASSSDLSEAATAEADVATAIDLVEEHPPVADGASTVPSNNPDPAAVADVPPPARPDELAATAPPADPVAPKKAAADAKSAAAGAPAAAKARRAPRVVAVPRRRSSDVVDPWE